ncbi:hypothetical protein CKAH01_02078 [Colletotrichum kahawae]|uniref:Uncharacterized protein n=1 Tax=Colletotrichum kahawae TaxID=34407 RepID=A0AAD9Y3L1_COLKA|nr:hypothetical protein CKAH01_02078 [Colletotrichum kahawae]
MERFRGGTCVGRWRPAPAYYFRALQQTPSSSILPGLRRAAFPASFDELRHMLGICAFSTAASDRDGKRVASRDPKTQNSGLLIFSGASSAMLMRDAARRMRGLRKGLFPAQCCPWT